MWNQSYTVESCFPHNWRVSERVLREAGFKWNHTSSHFLPLQSQMSSWPWKRSREQGRRREKPSSWSRSHSLQIYRNLQSLKSKVVSRQMVGSGGKLWARARVSNTAVDQRQEAKQLHGPARRRCQREDLYLSRDLMPSPDHLPEPQPCLLPFPGHFLNFPQPPFQRVNCPQ